MSELQFELAAGFVGNVDLLRLLFKESEISMNRLSHKGNSRFDNLTRNQSI